uniref:ACAD9/ACADV-like C-terminal domain-containing protein n=1 Tax=Glossina austeni TaxID=7395 RepID=A0A1A9UNQ6_GLOAU
MVVTAAAGDDIPAKPEITEDEGKVKIADKVPEEVVEEDFPLISPSIDYPEQERNYADYKKMVKELNCQTAHLENIKNQIQIIACKSYSSMGSSPTRDRFIRDQRTGLMGAEASRRAASSVGIGGTALSPYVTTELQLHGKRAGECIDLFGKTVESLLIKYGKGIIGEQCILHRLANSAIDIYAMIVTLSRASRAVRQNIPTAEHELNLTKAWCAQINVE